MQRTQVHCIRCATGYMRIQCPMHTVGYDTCWQHHYCMCMQHKRRTNGIISRSMRLRAAALPRLFPAGNLHSLASISRHL
jgi:hypothetical protein